MAPEGAALLQSLVALLALEQMPCCATVRCLLTQYFVPSLLLFETVYLQDNQPTAGSWGVMRLSGCIQALKGSSLLLRDANKMRVQHTAVVHDLSC
jgi:hypothetical protein